MTTLTVHEETAASTEKAFTPFESFTDARGRTIQLRQLNPLQYARLVIAVGSHAAENDTFMNGFALPAAMVERVGDDFYGFPTSLKQVEAVLAVLGNDGMAALNHHLYQKVEAARSQVQAGTKVEDTAAKN